VMPTPPPGYPGPIMTDASNEFGSHTMRVRVPAILDQTLAANPELHAAGREALSALRDEIASGAVMKPLAWQGENKDEIAGWRAAYARRAGQTWHSTDWFFAETYAYRRLMEAVGYFEMQIDPFLPIKHEEYASAQHQTLFDMALGVDSAPNEKLHSLLGMDLWGNRVDLSYAESRTHGMDIVFEDMLVDDRNAIIARLHDHLGDVHIVADNAGSELTMDLVLIDALLRDGWTERVVLQVKYHPTFVSDATVADVQTFLNACASGVYGPAASVFAARLQRAIEQGRFVLESDVYWNSPFLWWEMPEHLLNVLRGASLVFVKGDANYRRVVGDAFWPHETPFAQVVSGVGIPVACIRTFKSDPVVGLIPGVAERLQAADPRWRWSGRRGVIQAYIP
jgi:uncharacterized protein with ATP-grasp and redox domains